MTYWRLAGEFFCDHIYTSAFMDRWMQIFADPRPGREAIMDDAEQRAFRALPERVEVMRGYAFDGAEKAFSWTRSEQVARQFACDRSSEPTAGPPRIAHGTVRRDDVIAVLLRREEDEIIAPPEHVQIATVTELPGV